MDFLELGVKAELNRVLMENGIVKPTPVQRRTLAPLAAGRDIVAQAQTGAGKTLAFLLPILSRIKVKSPAAQALIVVPTRELALQITAVAEKLAAAVGVRVLTIYGGQEMERQLRKLGGDPPHLIVATPGRLLDHLRRRTVHLGAVAQVVLDEADQLLHMGFLEEVEAVIRQTPAKRQMMFFSATLPARIRQLAACYTRRPLQIAIQGERVVLAEIEQVRIDVEEEAKLDKLCDLLNEYQPYLAIVFCHTKQRVTAVAAKLAQRGYLVGELHGDLSQAKRNLVMRRFSAAKLQILAATDIAARGLDIEGVTHVFNYDMPRDAESYIHRIGRTGRAGETGVAVTFVTPRQKDYIRLIERGIRQQIGERRPASKPAAAQKPAPQAGGAAAGEKRRGRRPAGCVKQHGGGGQGRRKGGRGRGKV